MQHITNIHDRNSRIMQIVDELSAGCDEEFDAGRGELEREFAELRLIFNQQLIGKESAMKLKIIDFATTVTASTALPSPWCCSRTTARRAAARSPSCSTQPHHCAVLDVDKLAQGDIAFGSNSWRGDNFEDLSARPFASLQQPRTRKEPDYG